MENYTIYCTKEQTMKALDLGAPIKKLYPYESIDAQFSNKYVVLKHGYVDSTNRTTYTLLMTPTAEQMINWMEEQKLTFRIYEKFTHSWHYFVGDKKCRETVKDFDNVDSRAEATLAAIDAALDYLINKKEK